MNAHVDMAATCAPKSDQKNYEDLIGGPITIKITKVTANTDAPEQPVSVFFEGDEGRPYKPCKTCRRVMVYAWGHDASQYVGRSMTLYGDPGVSFGGMKVGGIRISHMSHIEKDMTMSVTVTRAKRAPYTVKKLEPVAPKPETDRAAAWAADYIAELQVAPDVEATIARGTKRLDELKTKRPELFAQCQAAIAAARGEKPAADVPPAAPAATPPAETF